MRSLLRGLEGRIFDILFESSSSAQLREWLQLPLQHAAREGDLKVIKQILAAGVRASDRIVQQSFLDGDTEVLAELLRPDTQSGTYLTGTVEPVSQIIVAAERGYDHILKFLLLQAGQEMRIGEAINGKTGEPLPPLHRAAGGGHLAAVEVLLDAGADPNLRGSAGIDYDSRMKPSPLDVAVSAGHAEIVQELIRHGADVKSICGRGWSPLHLACELGHLAVAKVLLDAGADVRLGGPTGIDSPLDLAASGGHADLVRELIRHGVSARTASVDGWTALHHASENDMPEAVEALVEGCAAVEAREVDSDRTPLHVAAGKGSRRAVLALLRSGADVGSRDCRSNTALHLAACPYWIPTESSPEVVDTLLRWGADETAVNEDDRTPAEALAARIEVKVAAGVRDVDQTSEVESRVFALLARAPADRAWRRRGLLVMCRALPDRVGLNRNQSLIGGTGVGQRGGTNTRSEWIANADEASRVVVNEENRCDVADGMEALLTRVLELQEEGVFRAIVVLL